MAKEKQSSITQILRLVAALVAVLFYVLMTILRWDIIKCKAVKK